MGRPGKITPFVTPFSHIPKPLPICCRQRTCPPKGQVFSYKQSLLRNGEPSGGTGGEKGQTELRGLWNTSGDPGSPCLPLHATLDPFLLNSPPYMGWPRPGQTSFSGDLGPWLLLTLLGQHLLCITGSLPSEVLCKLPPSLPYHLVLPTLGPGTFFLSSQPAPWGRPSCSAL